MPTNETSQKRRTFDACFAATSLGPADRGTIESSLTGPTDVTLSKLVALVTKRRAALDEAESEFFEDPTPEATSALHRAVSHYRQLMGAINAWHDVIAAESKATSK